MKLYMKSKRELSKYIQAQQEYMFDLACRIFDNPEYRGKEYFAAKLLTEALTAAGFQVELGVGGQETAFRATWSNGEGGPNIGILGEYDALEEQGHACGHHLQTPAAIGAAVAVKKLLAETNIPGTITVYGTPAEETHGGKILMAQQGCFRELDVALASHACSKKAFVGGTSMALHSYRAYFHGKSAHAAGAPWEGRSAGDAMLLSFQGIEFMREHVPDGTRIHYTIRQALAPSNVVPDFAEAGYTLRSKSNSVLEQLSQRFKKIIEGACLMTETTVELKQAPSFDARKPNLVLSRLAQQNLQQLQIPMEEPLVCDSGGSTDFGNVSCIVPGALVYLPYVAAPGHSQQWLEAGKTQVAKKCMTESALVLAGMVYDLLTNPKLVEEAKQELKNRGERES